jgi:hypothetical protein
VQPCRPRAAVSHHNALKRILLAPVMLKKIIRPSLNGNCFWILGVFGIEAVSLGVECGELASPLSESKVNATSSVKPVQSHRPTLVLLTIYPLRQLFLLPPITDKRYTTDSYGYHLILNTASWIQQPNPLTYITRPTRPVTAWTETCKQRHQTDKPEVIGSFLPKHMRY